MHVVATGSIVWYGTPSVTKIIGLFRAGIRLIQGRNKPIIFVTDGVPYARDPLCSPRFMPNYVIYWTLTPHGIAATCAAN